MTDQIFRSQNHNRLITHIPRRWEVQYQWNGQTLGNETRLAASLVEAHGVVCGPGWTREEVVTRSKCIQAQWHAIGLSPVSSRVATASAFRNVEIKTTEDLSMLNNLVLVHLWLQCPLDPALPLEDLIMDEGAELLTPVDKDGGDGNPGALFTDARHPPSSYTVSSSHHASQLDKLTRALRLFHPFVVPCVPGRPMTLTDSDVGGDYCERRGPCEVDGDVYTATPLRSGANGSRVACAAEGLYGSGVVDIGGTIGGIFCFRPRSQVEVVMFEEARS
ncbi:hypothetical protein HD554DRAFT_2036666 [Boletus coccyginus]|nr:hypothetical protein HD554DRAFT_2036666 [Boletus coccyginus]